VRSERDFNVVTNEHQLGRRERLRWQLPQLTVVFRSYLLSVRKNKSTLTQANYNSLTMSLSRESQCCPGTFSLSYHIRSIPGVRCGVSRHLSHTAGRLLFPQPCAHLPIKALSDFLLGVLKCKSRFFQRGQHNQGCGDDNLLHLATLTKGGGRGGNTTSWKPKLKSPEERKPWLVSEGLAQGGWR